MTKTNELTPKSHKKCRFADKCRLYLEGSASCDQTGGMYGFAESKVPMGCYAYNEKKERERMKNDTKAV